MGQGGVRVKGKEAGLWAQGNAVLSANRSLKVNSGLRSGPRVLFSTNIKAECHVQKSLM